MAENTSNKGKSKSTSNRSAKSRVTNASKTSSTKKSPAKRLGENNKVNMTQRDMDKLCEVYDWYIEVRDKIDFSNTQLYEIPSKFNQIVNGNEGAKSEEGKKTLSVKIDFDVWDDYDRLCKNLDAKKGDMLNFILKKVLNDFSDII